MASSVTIEETNARGLSVKKIKFTWTAHTDGVVSPVTTTYAYTGKVERFITDPDAGVAPTDNYDITIIDSDGYDILHAAGTDRDTSVTEQVLATSLGIVCSSKLTFAVANAGSGGKGVAYVYIR